MIPLKRPVKIITGDETLKVTREGRQIPKDVRFVDGKAVKINPIEFTITCNVQPFNGRDLLIVPENDRYKEQYWIFMNQKQKVLEVNDMVHRLGVNFVVQQTENWGSYSKCRIMRIDTGPLQSS